MPTVLSYLHYDQPYIAFGKDMLNGAVEESHALHWVTEFDGYEYVKGDYAVQFDGKNLTHAYRFRTDSLLQEDVLHTAPADTLQQMERELKAFVQQYMQRMNNNELVIKK